ncbi:hypothetical protein N7499_000355 [Penicillium canescens]|uniref:Rhodopsin domain-containing protein n=1 Tax=Penicillium canescens TaxID=5083 RepID=A0AAD6IGN8_PENCN|nr:uncharacterized protein N7446_011445 [Penicillium canescens]KAJ6004286.1 hypothetical protein N7522_005931 [Penicillium canescens]KAJ6029210.1 hypothetical protein N7444_012197 [Penicillium canescens]KAJ6047641.1 hypothetical protein N7460_003788 [Penicillium canescens]KAJ6048762.1 hypothetical protein N7446_011445 [Penicillium canescens]KAJ6100725.1 hypothetical protein N7499_000355 [Penicillium canescens]
MAYITADNGSLQPAFLAIMIVLLLLSCTSVILRLYCRIALVHKVGPDDHFIVTGLFVTIAMGVMNGFHISFGTGRHMADLDIPTILLPTLKHWYAYQLVYPLAIGLVKFSILAQYYRIFPARGFRIATAAVALFVFIYTVVVIFVNAFECRTKPWRAWDPTFPKGCNNLPAAYFSMAGANILTDLIILFMPLRLLTKLNLHRPKKYALIAIFLTGTFASAASFVRLSAIYKYLITKDVSYDAIHILIWSQVEVNVAIISASAPSLRPMLSSVFKGSSYDRSGKHQDGEHELSGTVGSSRRRTLPPHDCANVEFVLRDLEDCCDGDGNENVNGDGDGDGQTVSVDISNSVTVPVPAHVDGLGQGDISEVRQLGNITKTVVIEMKSEER